MTSNTDSSTVPTAESGDLHRLPAAITGWNGTHTVRANLPVYRVAHAVPHDSFGTLDSSDNGERTPTPSVDSTDLELQNLVYSVNVPPPRSLWEELKEVFQKALLSDDPWRRLQAASKRLRLWRAVCFVFPILNWARDYSWQKLRGDLVGGITIATIAVPQDLGYSGLAHLPPIYGLYSSFVPPLIYAVMGSSRHIAIGPVAVASLLLGSLLKSDTLDPTANPGRFLDAALAATLIAGLVQAGLGLCRLGFLIDFLSEAAIIGFMGGAAITIALQQLKGLLGIQNFTTSTDIVSVLTSVFDKTSQWEWHTILIGFSFLLLLIVAKEVGSRKKKLFFLSAASPLFCLVTATLLVWLTHADKHGVKIVGHITRGVNPPSLASVQRGLSGVDASVALKAGIVTGLIALTEAIAIGRSFAALGGYHLDGNMEMLAIGTANIAGSLTSCYVATGSFSRSAVNYQAGAKSAVSNIIMALLILLVLLALTPLVFYTPNAILAAIIINAVRSLVNVPAALTIWRVDKIDFLVTLGSFLGTLFVSVEIGLLIAVVISGVKVLLHISRPPVPVLGQLPGTLVFRNTAQYPEAVTHPGIGILRVDANIYFVNSAYLRQRLVYWVEDEEEKLQSVPDATRLKYLVLEMTPVSEIDTTGIRALEELDRILKAKGVQMVLSNPGGRVMEKLSQAGLVTSIGPEWFFLSIDEAVAACQRLMAEDDSGVRVVHVGGG